MNFEAEDFLRATTRKQLIQIAREKAIPIDKVISKIDEHQGGRTQRTPQD